MKRFFFINCVLMIFCLSVFGQKSNADLKQLQKEIGSSAPITTNDVSFPAVKSVKIYLAIKHSKNSAKDFAQWINEWNQKNAARFGELQIVDKLADADIAAVLFQHGTGRIVREESVGLKIGKSRSHINDDEDRFVLNRVGNSSVRATDAVVNLWLPVYSYLIVREPNSSWAIDYSRVDDRISKESFPERLLQSAIENRLKNR